MSGAWRKRRKVEKKVLKKIKRLLSKSMLSSLMLSNFLVLFLSVLISLVSYQGYIRFSLEQARDYNTVIIRQVKDEFDSKIESVIRIAQNIINNSYVEQMAYADSIMNSSDRYNAMQITNLLQNYTTVYDFIDSILLYYKKNQLLFTNATMYSKTEDFFRNSRYSYWDPHMYLFIKVQKKT